MSASAAPPLSLCRDCLALDAGHAARCFSCGSPRLIINAARTDLAIAHVDCDAFYASVEKRDRPELRDVALIVGGGQRRGVVSTCCYIARTAGVRSAMPMAEAMRLCPGATVVAPDMAKYAAVSRDIRHRMRALTPLVEPLSIDEAFLDLSGCEGANGGGAIPTLARFACDVERDCGVTVSVGLSDCKFLAKLASDRDKPRGFTIIGRDEAIAVLAPMPVSRLWGVGRASEARLERAGLKLIADIQALEEAAMAAKLGGEGRRLWRLAHGLDDRRVSIVREAKSISAETTFDEDEGRPARLEAVLLQVCERVSERLRKQELACCGVTLKLRGADFRLRTRTRSGLRPTQLPTRIFAAAREMLAGELASAPFRLIGVAAAQFEPAEVADAVDLVDDIGAEKARERAIVAVREKFGAGAIVRGLAYAAPGARPAKRQV